MQVENNIKEFIKESYLKNNFIIDFLNLENINKFVIIKFQYSYNNHLLGFRDIKFKDDKFYSIFNEEIVEFNKEWLRYKRRIKLKSIF